MPPIIGIPRSLMYYRYFPLWIGFFKGLGLQVATSPETNKGLLERGLKRALDDVCLPIKAGYGHVLDVAERCDALFLPRLICVEEDAYLCPKFMGFTDMVRMSIPEIRVLLDPVVNEKKRSQTMSRALAHVGRKLGFSRAKVAQSLSQALSLHEAFLQGLIKTSDPMATIRGWEDHLSGKREDPPIPVVSDPGNAKRIAVLGHSYTLYDSYLSMGLLKKLSQAGVNTVRADSVDRPSLESFLEGLHQRPFWSSGKEAIGSSLYYLNKDRVDGFIYVLSFECGPDSMCREVVDYQAGLYRVPLLSIVLDEHTAEAGLVTRLQAFLEMLKR